MEITLDRKNSALHLEARNDEGIRVQLDGSPDFGGEGLGMRPMQLLLASLAACSSMDVLSILKKMKTEPAWYRVKANGQREPNVVPSLFTDINLEFILPTAVPTANAEKAIKLSTEKYCSVHKHLEATTNITWSLVQLDVQPV